MKRWLDWRLSTALRWILAGVVSAVLLGAPPALAQDKDLKALLDRLDRLERDIRTLNIQLSRGGPLPSPAVPGDGSALAVMVAPARPALDTMVARFDVRLTSIEGDVRVATGQVEELAFQLNGVTQRLDKLVGDVDYRLSALERAMSERPAAGAVPPPGTSLITAAPSPPSVQSMAPGTGGQGFASKPGILGTITDQDLKAISLPGAAAGQATAAPLPAPQTAAPAAAGQSAAAPAASGVLPQGTSKERYEYARTLLFTQQFDKAEVALREFVATYPQDPLLTNARYWLGETYYVRRDFRTAAIVFAEGYQEDKQGKKAPDMLLKLGMALANMDNTDDACRAFAELIKEYPDAQEHIRQGVVRERRRSGCK